MSQHVSNCLQSEEEEEDDGDDTEDIGDQSQRKKGKNNTSWETKTVVRLLRQVLPQYQPTVSSRAAGGKLISNYWRL